MDFKLWLETAELKWIVPFHNTEHNEVLSQLKELPKNENRPPNHVLKALNVFKDINKFKDALDHGRIENIYPNDTHKINNHTFNDFDSLNPEKKKRVYSIFNNNKNIEMPIILHHKKTDYNWLLSGNTRLTFNSQINKKYTPTLILDY